MAWSFCFLLVLKAKSTSAFSPQRYPIWACSITSQTLKGNRVGELTKRKGTIRVTFRGEKFYAHPKLWLREGARMGSHLWSLRRHSAQSRLRSWWRSQPYSRNSTPPSPRSELMIILLRMKTPLTLWERPLCLLITLILLKGLSRKVRQGCLWNKAFHLSLSHSFTPTSKAFSLSQQRPLLARSEGYSSSLRSPLSIAGIQYARQLQAF
jgi:hypothetical protein